MVSLNTFILSPEQILFYFLKNFYAQERLYEGIENPFIFTNNLDNNSLIIQMAEDFDGETPNAIPALVIQEGGFQENKRTLGPGRLSSDSFGNNEQFKTLFYHSYSIHCIAMHRAEAKWLQAATTKALILYRWALYEIGIRDISPIVGNPPQKIRGDGSFPESYDCVIQFQLVVDDDWILTSGEYTEEKINIQITTTIG